MDRIGDSYMQAQVISSAAAGLTAAAAINIDLITADATAKISADVVGAGNRHGAAFVDSPEAWDERYADSAQVWSGQPNGALMAEVSTSRLLASSMSGAVRVPTRCGWPNVAGR